MSKEMLGGCCVCSDERGWTENPLVYCDGQGCTVAVHQACYGIVTVPIGPWFCRKCESQERAARVRCELCPSKDGALKRTDNSGWAHVVCALYIPEVRFGNVTTMEPIILQLIPTERYSKICYICQEQGKGTKSTVGACMQCNKSGCKQQFHVTCAQALGLLCEEAGNYLDNVKYCGYCQHHYSKLKKGGNVKTIPPYKPISSVDNGSSDSSPEKESEASARSSGKKKSYLTSKPLPLGAKSKSHSPNPSPGPDGVFGLNTSNESDKDNSASGEGVTLKIGTTSSHAGSGSKENSQDGTELKKKFTTSNFTETVVTESEPVFGTDTLKTTVASEGSKGLNKKRKSSLGNVTPPVKGENAAAEIAASLNQTIVTSSLSSSAASIAATLKNPTVSITNLKTNILASATKNTINISGLGKSMMSSGPKTNLTVTGTGTKITISTQRDVVDKDSSRAKTETTSSLAAASLAAAATTSAAEKTSGDREDSKLGISNHNDSKSVIADIQPAKRARSSSSEKNRKNRRNPNPPPNPPKRSGRAPSATAEMSPLVKEIKDSPPESPTDELKKGLKKKIPPVTVKTEEKDLKPFQNAISVPHMLGNQLNPSSSMAQKMHDSLNQEVEAHSIYTSEASTNLVGPQLHSKVIASVRTSNAERNASLSAANSLLSLGNSSSSSSSNSTSTSSSQGPTQAQSLEQLLERQWEQGSQFLMEQAQHFDIASLLSCLHQLKAENLKLEEHVNSLLQRRDHLLAVNARLAVPLNTQPSTPGKNALSPEAVRPGMSGTSGTSPLTGIVIPVSQAASGQSTPAQQQPQQQQNDRTQRQQQFVSVENGLLPEPSPNYTSHAIRHNPTSSMYGGQTGGVRNSISMDSSRRPGATSYQGYPTSGSAQVPVVTSPSMVIRREDAHQQM